MQLYNRDDVVDAFLAGEIEVDGPTEEWLDEDEDLLPDFEDLE